MERRDSKGASSSQQQQNRKSQQSNNKSRGNNNNFSGKLHNQDERNQEGGQKQQKSCQGKLHGGSSVALVRSKPCREIYRPPSLRKGRCNSDSNKEGKNGHHPLDIYNNGDYGENSQQNYISTSVPSSPLVSRNVESNCVNRNFNVNAQEFQLAQAQQQAQLNFAFSSQGISQGQEYYENSRISSSCYPLNQSKSSGNMNVLLQRQQSQNYPLMAASFTQTANLGFNFGQQLNLHVLQKQQQQNQGILLLGSGTETIQENERFNRLQQSKSSGNIPVGFKPRVRFKDCTSTDFGETKNPNDNASHDECEDNVSFKSSTAENALKLKATENSFSLLKMNDQKETQKITSSIKRSKSFGSEPLRYTCVPPSLEVCSYEDFQISLWPSTIQESVTTAVTAGVDRVSARHRIEMVNQIFEAMLESSEDKELEKQDVNDKGEMNYDQNVNKDTDLTSAAVHIFLYFMKRDKTVVESLLNTCFATFQKMKSFGGLGQTVRPTNVTQAEDFSNKWIIFLKFLSHMYTKVKVIRMQNELRILDEMNFTLLALLCDSCLITLRSPMSYTPKSMDSLFTVLTSIGRDMESTFPLKMKQLLAAVRDALLGLGPYSNPAPLSSTVQKTLMQLIELHAANWHLPASAVRYYYTNPSKSSFHKNNNSFSNSPNASSMQT